MRLALKLQSREDFYELMSMGKTGRALNGDGSGKYNGYRMAPAARAGRLK